MDNLLLRDPNQGDLPEMYTAFLAAFSDYSLQFNLTEGDFYRKFVEKLNIDFSLSAIAVSRQKIVAFIFTSLACYDGRLTAYNGGTGVIPTFRGQHLTARLYANIIPLLKEKHVEQCVLEVLTTNFAAIRAYEKIGFKKSRYFNCFKLLSGPKKVKSLNKSIKISECSQPEWSILDKCDDINTSFLDSLSLLKNNLKNEVVITAENNNQTIAYAVYQRNGRFSRVGVHQEFRNQGVGSALVNYVFKDCGAKELTIMNVNQENESIIRFLTGLGFINQVDQYELKLVL